MSVIEQIITDNLDIWSSAVKAKSAAGRGTSKKIELYGIKKLRALILELAVRGKLVPQENNWKQTCLDDLGVWAVGSGFPKDEQGKEGLEIMFAKVSDMNLPENAKFIAATNHTISVSTAEKLRVNVHAPGTVIFPKIGGAIATNKRRILMLPTAIDNNCLGITPKESVSTDWLYLVLSSIDLSKYQAGTSVPALSQGTLSKIPVGLPAPAEQHRIVAKVDELMALCDQLGQQTESSISAHQILVKTLLGTLTSASERDGFNEAWARIADHFDTLLTTEWSIDQLKQTILQLAVMGKLVPQNPNDEPASELLKKIASEKARLIKKGKIKKQKPLPPIGKDEKPFELPEGWEWKRIAEFSIVGTGSTPSRDNMSYYVPPEFSWVTSGETNNDFVFETKENISQKAIKETNVSIYPVGTLIVAMYGQGKTRGQITELMIKAGTNQACAAIQLVENSKHHRGYTKLFFKKAYEELRSHSAGGAQPNLNVGKISLTVVPVPPLEEQRRIVAKVDELMALCDTLKARINTAQITQLHLADAMAEQAVA